MTKYNFKRQIKEERREKYLVKILNKVVDYYKIKTTDYDKSHLVMMELINIKE